MMRSTSAQMFDLRRQAAALGNTTAQAQVLACELRDPRADDPNETWRQSMQREPKKVEISVEQQQVVSLLRSGNPQTINEAIKIALGQYANVQLDLPSGLGAQPWTRVNRAGELLGCDFGARCTRAQNARALDSKCAYQGYCDVSSIPDALHFFELSPANAQKVEEMRELFRRAIVTGDFNRIQFVPRTHPPAFYGALNGDSLCVHR